MRRSPKWTLFLGALLVLALGVAACGGSSGGSSESGTSQGTPAKGKQGGKLISLWAGDVDFIDPGETYYQMGTPRVTGGAGRGRPADRPRRG